MKKTIITLAVLFFASLLQANEPKRYYEHFTYEVASDQGVDKAREKVDTYLKSVHATVLDLQKSFNDESETLSVHFAVSDDKKAAVFTLLEEIGTTSLVRFKKTNYEEEITHLRYHKALLEEIKKEYKEQFKTFQTISDKDSMRDTIDKMRTTTLDIYGIQKEIKQLSRDTSMDHYHVTFTKIYPKKILKEEENATQGYTFTPSGVQVDFALINVETPKEGFSSPFYSGYEISYLFNQDQTVFKIATLSGIPAATSAKQMNKLFMYSYGQNFYPKSFRSGDNALSYLYSGFDIGGYASTLVDKTARNRMFISSHIGYELYKNDYITIDGKVAYFIPFGIDELLNFRGFKYNLSVKVLLD